MKHLQSWEGLLALLLVGVIAVNAAIIPEFLGPSNLINLFQLSIEKAVLALFMTFIIINAEIDLSVGSMMGLSAAAFATLIDGGTPAGWAIPASLAVGLAGGALNGWFIARVGLPSLVVTLSSMIGFRGIARILVEDRSIGGFPDWFTAPGQAGLAGVALFVVLALLLFAVLERSAFGRKVYVVGVNRAVADFAGIDTGRVKFILFALSGLAAAAAGLMLASRFGSVRGDAGNGFELDVITMVLLGGVSIFGGVGSLRGVILAILIVLTLRNGMGLMNVTGHIQTGVVGLLLIASVLVPRLPVFRRGRA